MTKPPQFRTGIDRMDHPISHTSAVVAAVVVIPWGSMTYIGISHPLQWRSWVWTGIYIFLSTLLISSVVTYLRPTSRLAFIPVLATGATLLVLWAVFYVGFAADRNDHSWWWSVIKAAIMLIAYFSWAILKWRQLRATRSPYAQESPSETHS